MRFVDVYGRLKNARRAVSRASSVSESDVDSPPKLAEIIRQLSARVQEMEAKNQAEAVEFEVNVTAGTPVRLNHNFGVPVRWYVTYWKSSESSSSVTTAENVQEKYQSNSPIVERATSLNYPWNTVVAGNAQGCRFRMKTVRPIVGVRFGWMSGGGALTVTGRVWNDTTGTSLASGTVAVNNAGVYTVMFSSPITTDLTGTNITCSYYNATRMTTTNDVTWKGASIELNDNLTLINNALTDVGDVRPTTTHGAAVSCICEPILAVSDDWTYNTTMAPELSFNASSTLDQLLLDCYSTGRAVIRVEPAQAGIT